MPSQVHFRCAHLTSYSFLQPLPLASNALAFGLPSLSLRGTGFLQSGGFASFAGQTKTPVPLRIPGVLCSADYTNQVSVFGYNFFVIKA